MRIYFVVTAFVILFTLQTLVSGAISEEKVSVLVQSPNSPISTSSGVSGSMQCTKNSDESYAVCASNSNIAIKYNLQPFSFAAKGPNQGNYMTSCDLYETASQSTSRAVCVKGNTVEANGVVYFHSIPDMTVNTTVVIGTTGNYPHVIVDTPNEIAYISNYNNPPAIYKITNISSSTPFVAATLTSFGSGDKTPAAMLIIDGFLYVHFATEPASRLARINISTFTWNQTVVFASGESNGDHDNLANDDNFIYDATLYGFLVRCTYKNNNFSRFDRLVTAVPKTYSLAISPDSSFLLLTAYTSGIMVVNTSTFSIDSSALLPNPTSSGYVGAFGRPIILSKNNNTNSYPVYAFSQYNDYLYTFNVSRVPFRDAYPTIYPLPSSPISSSSGVSGSLQCTENSDESYAVCASISNTAIKYNLQPFSFAAKGPALGSFVRSCDLYETSSQSTSRAVCVKGKDATNGAIYFHRVSDMTVNKSVTSEVAGQFPQIIVDTPNQIAYISSGNNPPAIYKITNIGSSTPIVVGNLTSFGSGDINPSAMLIIDGFLYVHCSMYPAARLARINISTFTWNRTVAFVSGEHFGGYDNLANDDNYIYDLTLSGILVRCKYNKNNVTRFDSLKTAVSNSLGISPDRRTLFVISSDLSLLLMVDVASFAMFGNTIMVPNAMGRPIVTSSRNIYAFCQNNDYVYAFRYSNPTKTQSITKPVSSSASMPSTSSFTTSRSTSKSTSSSMSVSTSKTRSFTVHNRSTPTAAITLSLSDSPFTPSPSRSRTISLPNTSTVSRSRTFATFSPSPSSSITTSRSSSTSTSNSMLISSSISIVETISITKSETIVDCRKILSEYKCNSSHCQWCHDLGACVRSTEDCSSIQCSSFSNDAWKIDTNLCPNLTCRYCSKTRTCLNRTENPVCSCAIASTSSLACGASPGECFWCKNEFSYFGQPPNSVSLCIDNETSRSAPDQFCTCEFLSKDVCSSSVTCAWCDTTGGCFDTSVKTCDKVRCTDFTNVAANGQCPSPACQICDGICVNNNTEYSGDRCNVKYFDQTTCKGCHNCTWNEQVLAGVNDAKPYCVMSQHAASCPSPLTCSSINLPGFDRENQCLAAGCKYDQQKQECLNFMCFNLFLPSFIIQPIGLLIIGFIKDVIMLLLFGVFGDRVVKILKRKFLVPFKFWKNKWDKNKIKVNLERTIYVNDSKARDFTSDKGESFEEYCQKIADKFFELPETNDEEIRKDWKRRVVDAVTFAMFDTGLWFDLDDDGYGKLDDEKEPKKLNGVEGLMMNDAREENENAELEIRQEQQQFTPREENDARDEDDSEIMQHATFRKMREDYEKKLEINRKQLQFVLQNAPKEVTQRFRNQFTDAKKQELQQAVKKLFIAKAGLLSRHVLQQIVTDEITEHATCVVYFASSRVTSIRAATALNSFPSPLQLFYYLLGVIFLVSSSFASVLTDENQYIISRIASYSCTSSNSTSSSASSDVGVFRSTFILLGFRLMNASTVATVFLVLVKTVRAIWASYGGRFNQLQLPQRLPIMRLYTKRSSQILLGFYFGVVLIFALVGFFYGFKVTASLKVMGVTIAFFVGDALLLNLIRFWTSRFQEKDVEKQKKEIKVEEEELASRLISNVNFDESEQPEHAKVDFDEITAEEAIDVKKQSMMNSAPTSLPQALIVFLLTEEFPTVLLTIALQLCYNYMCLVEYKSSFGFTDETISEISTKEYDSRSMKCIWELFENDVSGYANALSSFVALL